MFNLANCSFQVSKGKAKAARVVVNRDFGIKSCYTLESSFNGGSQVHGRCAMQVLSAAAVWQGTTKGLQYTTQCYEEMGRGLCHSVLLCFTRSKVLMSTVAQLHTQFPAGVTEDVQVAALRSAHCSACAVSGRSGV